MKIEEEQIGGVVVLKPQGPLVKAGADQLRDRLVGERNATGGLPMVLDVSAVPFADSSGLEVLFDATVAMAHTAGPLRLAGLNETLQEAMELTEIEHLFEQFEDVTAAVRSVE